MKFNVTYEVITPESAEHGDAEDRGFELKDCSLREAIDYMCGEGGIEGNSSVPEYCNWITAYKADYDYETGAETSYSLHFPDNMTVSSRIRVMRLVGAYGV